MQLFETRIPYGEGEGHQLQDFLLTHSVDGKIEKQIREFLLYSCYTPQEVRAKIHERNDRPYRLLLLEGFAESIRKGWVIEAAAKTTGIGLLIFPDDDEHGEHSSTRAFMERHARFLVVKDRQIVELLPIHTLDA